MASLGVAALIMIASVVSAPEQATTAGPAAAETATQFYTRYQAAMANASTVDEVIAFWAADLVKEFTAAPAAERTDLAGLKRIYSLVSHVKVTRETLTGSPATGATLRLEGTGRDQKTVTGTVHLVKENGAWKLFGPEDWN
jgi:hypothetical protein